MRHKIVIRKDRPLKDIGMARLIRKAVRAALNAENVDVPCRIEIRMTDDENIRALNREHRNIDRATDVLSFPLMELVPGEFYVDEFELDPETGTLAPFSQADSWPSSPRSS